MKLPLSLARILPLCYKEKCCDWLTWYLFRIAVLVLMEFTVGSIEVCWSWPTRYFREELEGGEREREREVDVYMCVRICDHDIVMLLGPYKKNTPLPATYLSNSNITTHTLYFGYSIILYYVAMNRLHVMNQCVASLLPGTVS